MTINPIPNVNLGTEGIEKARFWRALLEWPYIRSKAVQWSTDVSVFDIEKLAEQGEDIFVYDYGTKRGTVHLHAPKTASLRITLFHGEIEVQAFGNKQEVLDEFIGRVLKVAPKSQPDDGMVEVHFWTHGMHGPVQRIRSIETRGWEKIKENYSPTVTNGLEPLMVPSFRPAGGGNLMLWHGPPGTGKTNMIRALAAAWKEWADFHYIVDPEKFFGDKADYMLDVALSEDHFLGMETPPEPRWNVILLEDCGELISSDAKVHSGQAVSRLLNLTDGLIGQGARVLLLVTTNEPLKKLHEAASRPGRAVQNVHFGRLNEGRSRKWLEEHGADEDRIAEVDGEMTLAQLYGICEKYGANDAKPEEVAVGFN